MYKHPRDPLEITRGASEGKVLEVQCGQIESIDVNMFKHVHTGWLHNEIKTFFSFYSDGQRSP